MTTKGWHGWDGKIVLTRDTPEEDEKRVCSKTSLEESREPGGKEKTTGERG